MIAFLTAKCKALLILPLFLACLFSFGCLTKGHNISKTELPNIQNVTPQNSPQKTPDSNSVVVVTSPTEISKEESPTPSPVKQILTKPKCDPNYSGCVPIASDVDCAEGKGNGPAYTTGPVQVIGTDVYDLDRDGDGIACE